MLKRSTYICYTPSIHERPHLTRMRTWCGDCLIIKIVMDLLQLTTNGLHLKLFDLTIKELRPIRPFRAMVVRRLSRQAL